MAGMVERTLRMKNEPTLFALSSVDFGTGVLRNFTKVQILHPVAGALALVALIWGLVSLLPQFLLSTTDANLLPTTARRNPRFSGMYHLHVPDCLPRSARGSRRLGNRFGTVDYRQEPIGGPWIRC